MKSCQYVYISKAMAFYLVLANYSRSEIVSQANHSEYEIAISWHPEKYEWD